MTDTSDEYPPVSIVCLFRGETEFIPLLKSNFQELNYPKDKLELLIIDDAPESSIDSFLDDDRYLYLHLNSSEIDGFIEKIKFPDDTEQQEGILKQYLRKIARLPNGFKRDYGVGMSSYDLIFHMDVDTCYHKDALTRKLKFLRNKKVDCVYNSNLLCHDIHQNDFTKLYKSESPYHIYEGTLLHTREYWKNGGFKWSDISGEGRFFSDNHGQQRKMDNYYDSVKMISIRNIQEYRLMALDLQQSEFKYELNQDCIQSIQINYNPVKDGIEMLFRDKDVIEVLGLQSQFIESLESNERYRITNLTDKIKQTKLAKQIQGLGRSFQVLLFGSKQPAWSLFEKVSFDCILIETHKNMEQMHSILLNCKQYKYIYLNGLYINESLIRSTSQSTSQSTSE